MVIDGTSITVPLGTTPGHLMMKGMRKEFTGLEDTVRTGTPEEAAAAVAEFQKGLKAGQPALKEFFDLVFTSEGIEKIKAHDAGLEEEAEA